MDIKYIDGNVPEPYQYAQALLDRFVSVSYNTLYDALYYHSKLNDTEYLSEQIIPVLRDNPPFTTIPKYLRDGRPNYLWYSDFYDDAGKDVFRRYRGFHYELKNITTANYTEELQKIDLPYFTELVKLISLEKLYLEAVQRIPATKEKTSDETANV